MRVLLIGDPESIWTKEFIDKVLLPIGASISIQPDPDAAGRFDGYFRENGVNVIGHYKLSPPVMKIPKLRVLYRQWRKKAALKPYRGTFDAVIVLYVTPFAVKCAKALSNENTKTYAVFIGSDILRSTMQNTKALIGLLADNKTTIVCESCQTEAAFNEKIGKKISQAAKVIYFGDEPFCHIDEQLALGSQLCKRKYGIPEDLISVCIGYNASPAQQHINVTEKISLLDDVIKNKICIIVPAAYGGDRGYISAVSASLASSGVKYRVLTDFLCAEDVASLRVATDIFINAQTTDSISASVMEAYYAGARLLNADWLEYREFSDWDLSYDGFESFEDICPLIEKYVKNAGERTNKNRSIVKHNWSWGTCKNKWNNLLYKGEMRND